MVISMGDYKTIDKTKEREKIRRFLRSKDFIDIGITNIKKKHKSKDLEFDNKGKWKSKNRT